MFERKIESAQLQGKLKRHWKRFSACLFNDLSTNEANTFEILIQTKFFPKGNLIFDLSSFALEKQEFCS